MVAAYLLLFLQSSICLQETETTVLTAVFFFAVKTHLCLNFFVLVFSIIMPPIHSLHYNDQFLQTAHVTILRRMKDDRIFIFILFF